MHLAERVSFGMRKLILSKVVNGSGVPAVGCLGFAESSQLSYRGITEERSICMVIRTVVIFPFI